MRIDVLTLFPEVFEPFLGHGIVGRARAFGVVQIHCTNFRDFAKDRHKTVDDRPYGGGPGMLLTCGPVMEAAEHLDSLHGESLRILLSPQGEKLTQGLVCDLSRQSHLMLICGHYEGFDDRLRHQARTREVSIGDYVLSGGEPAAMVLIDAMVRLLPGALGAAESIVEESFSENRLEYPQYTRPRDFRGLSVPEVLLSGDHGAIARWRKDQALARTKERRPDLLGISTQCSEV